MLAPIPDGPEFEPELVSSLGSVATAAAVAAAAAAVWGSVRKGRGCR